jgi:hypothetical protein
MIESHIFLVEINISIHFIYMFFKEISNFIKFKI